MNGFEQLKWHVAHDPCRVGDRFPLGAVRAGESVRVSLRVDGPAMPAVEGVDLLMQDGAASWASVPMARREGGFESTFLPAANPHAAFYAFRLHLVGGADAYYVPRADGRATAGQLVFPDEDGTWSDGGWSYGADRLEERPMGEFGLAFPPRGFQLTVYEPMFATPSWAEGAVMYQVFPDRFARGSKGALEEGVAYHEKMGRPVHLRKKWDDVIAWRSKTVYDPVDFYGGTLEGIREALPYLESLGVGVLYLNPVFEARSNHRYDTADYERIDPLLGTEEDFCALVEEASDYGIAVILDAVLSHTGDDSRYFNARENYDGLGAAQGFHSPYFGWYDFSPQPDGSPYRSWWGHLSLPEVDEHDPAWQRYILGAGDGQDAGDGGGGVLSKWLKLGVRGYRLDVADELPDDVLARLRTSVKATDPGAIIIGEVWEDPTTKESYGAVRDYALGYSLDSVMNYPLREALLGFALGRLDAYQLATFLKSQMGNYPQPLYKCLMNLLSSHDVERVRSVLATGGPLKYLPREKQLKAVCAITPERDELAARLQVLVAALVYALPGMPCVYYGDERGMQGGGDPFCRATFPSSDSAAAARSDCGKDLTPAYRQLGRLRKGSRALCRGAMACMAPHPDVVCVLRVLPEDGSFVVAVANRSDHEQHAVLDVRAADLGLPEEAIAVVSGASGPLPAVVVGSARSVPAAGMGPAGSPPPEPAGSERSAPTTGTSSASSQSSKPAGSERSFPAFGSSRVGFSTAMIAGSLEGSSQPDGTCGAGLITLRAPANSTTFFTFES